MALASPVVAVGELGQNLSQVFTPISQTNDITPEYPGLPFLPGTRTTATNGSEWIFVTSSGAIPINSVVWIDPTFAAVALIGGTGGATAVPEAGAGFVGFCQYAGVTATGYSFWAMISGVPNVLVSSASVTGPLYTSDTAGSLTGVTNTSSHYQVSGITCTVTASGSTASATLCVANSVSIRKPQAGS